MEANMVAILAEKKFVWGIGEIILMFTEFNSYSYFLRNKKEKEMLDKHSIYIIAQCFVLNHITFFFLFLSQRGSRASVSFQITSEVQSGRSPRLSFSSGSLTPATYENSNIAIYEVNIQELFNLLPSWVLKWDSDLRLSLWVKILRLLVSLSSVWFVIHFMDLFGWHCFGKWFSSATNLVTYIISLIFWLHLFTVHVKKCWWVQILNHVTPSRRYGCKNIRNNFLSQWFVMECLKHVCVEFLENPSLQILRCSSNACYPRILLKSFLKLFVYLFIFLSPCCLLE